MQLALPQAVQPSAPRPVHTEGILLPGCGASCLAGIGDGIMSYTDLWVDLIWLLLYNKDANMGPGMAPAQSPAKQAAAWSQTGHRPPGSQAVTCPKCVCASSAGGISTATTETPVVAKAAVCQLLIFSSK